MVEAHDTTARTSLFLRSACLPCSTYCSSTPARAFFLRPARPSPDGPLTHFASPRGEKYRLVFPPPPSGSYKRETSGSVSTPLDPEDFTSSSRPRAGGRAAPRNAWLLQRRGRLRATGRAGSIHGTDRRPRPTGQTRSVRQSPRRLHAITGAASTRAPSGSRLAQTILFAASMMWRAEIPNRSSKDAEGPLRGMDRTASL